MRNAELKKEVRSPKQPVGCDSRTVHSAFRIPHSAFLFLAQRQEVGKEPIRARDAGRELSEEAQPRVDRSEEHTSELQSPCNLVCRLLLEKKKKKKLERRCDAIK